MRSCKSSSDHLDKICTFASDVEELRGGNNLELMILFRFQLAANKNQDASCELKAPEVMESFSHSLLIFWKQLVWGCVFWLVGCFFGFVGFFLPSQAEEENYAINKAS